MEEMPSTLKFSLCMIAFCSFWVLGLFGIVIQMIIVEASCHRGPRGRQMDAPFQLKMIPASANLQKMFGHTIQ